jgi:hypothetical protein
MYALFANRWAIADHEVAPSFSPALPAVEEFGHTRPGCCAGLGGCRAREDRSVNRDWLPTGQSLGRYGHEREFF